MSKGFGKVQLAIIDSLKKPNEDGYYYSIHYLEDLTGFSRRSINRAINGLVDKKIVKHSRVTHAGWGGTHWYYEYLLVENEHLEDENQAKQELKRQEDEIKAKELGYKSSFEMGMSEMAARLG